jgi:hypothetical protein
MVLDVLRIEWALPDQAWFSELEPTSVHWSPGKEKQNELDLQVAGKKDWSLSEGVVEVWTRYE